MSNAIAGSPSFEAWGEDRDGRTPCGVYRAVDLGERHRSESTTSRRENGMQEDRATAIARYRREITKRYRAAYEVYATKICGDPSRAEVAMRAAFDQAFRSLQACGSPDRFATWFFEILTHHCEHTESGRPTRPLRIDELAHDLP